MSKRWRQSCPPVQQVFHLPLHRRLVRPHLLRLHRIIALILLQYFGHTYMLGKLVS